MKWKSMRGNKNGETHGMYKTPVYNSWYNMKSRCLNRNATAFGCYGGRGITICQRWMRFEHFYKDMGDRPDGLTLDRKDNSKGYSKSNCRWATKEQQAQNTRGATRLSIFGETKCIFEWLVDPRCVVNRSRFCGRMDRGWPPDIALTADRQHWRRIKGKLKPTRRYCGTTEG